MKLHFVYTILLFFGLFYTSLAQEIIVTGTIKDETNEPVPGAIVMVKGTDIGVSADFDGNYTIKTNVGATLVFSSLGMKTQEKKVTNRSQIINVNLEMDVQEIEGVVVMGYGKAKNISSSTGSVVQVKVKELADAPSANVIDVLQGKVAGLDITSTSGEPGSKSVLKLHGEGNISAPFYGADSQIGQPLYVLDGVPVSSGVISAMNPSDFETVTVMKDASATSIYGARAANGVIYITTKKGKQNEGGTVSINSQVGFSNLYSYKFYDDLMNTQQFLSFWKERGIISQDDVDGINREYPYDTRWDQYFFKKNVPTSQTSVSIVGGGEKNSYFISAGHFKQEGIMYRSNYERYTLRASIDSQVNKWLQVGLSISAGTNENSSSYASGQKVLMPPFYTLTNKDGSRLDYFYDPLIGRRIENPKYLADKNPSVSKNQDLLPTGFVSIEPFENFTFKSQLGIQYSVSEGENKVLPSWGQVAPETRRDYSKFLSKTLTNTMEYKFNLGLKNNFNLLVGQESLYQDVSRFEARSGGQINDALTMLSHGTQNISVGDGRTVTTFNSFFSRFDYNYANRYFIDISARRDGSSNFGENNQYANFWAVGLLWRMSDESFLRNVDWIDLLNLKFSTGISGDASAAPYSHLTLIEPGSQYKGRLGYSIKSLGNPDLQWEKQHKTNIGLSVGLFKSVSLDIDAYNRVTRDMILTVTIPSTTGFSTMQRNVSKIQNRGIDISLSVDLFQNLETNTYIRPYLVFNYNDQKILSINPDLSENPIKSFDNLFLKEGEPMLYAMPIFNRVNPDTGAPEWFLPGSDPTITQTDASQITDTYNPSTLAQNTGKKRQAPIAGGFGLNASYRAFSMQAGFSFKYGHYMINRDKLSTDNPSQHSPYLSNLSKNAENYWKKPGDNTPYPAASYVALPGIDTRLLEDASFIRLKNVNVSYTLPNEVIQRIGFFKGIRIYGVGRNLLTFTDYSGADPEFSVQASLGGFPSTKEYAFGIEVKF